ncbi:transposase [Streptomyces maoxianensis]|uniref:Transposase n=1 Tax=Streptomyces maoxianensis TaxID=1459942 RepID=A0ABV9G0D0_9ACTN
MTDTLGLLLVVAVAAANIGDRDAAAGLLRRLHHLHRDITLVWADGDYTGSLVDWCRQKLALTLQIVKRTDDMAGFVILPRRWVAERTFAWLMDSRRLARDYETLPASSEAVIRWSNGHADESASDTTTDRRPALNAPDVSCRSHPRSARRLARAHPPRPSPASSPGPAPS